MSFIVQIYHPHPPAGQFKEMVILSEAESEVEILSQEVRQEYQKLGYNIEAWELGSLGENWPPELPIGLPLFPE